MEGLSAAVPHAVSFETSGPGDDLSLELADGSNVEVQAKKGLRADQRFWSAIDALCQGVHTGRCNYGILIVCPNSSGSVRRRYAHALERIGNGRGDDASPEQIRLADRLEARGYDVAKVCERIRIRMVSALEDAGDAVAAARAELGHICANDHQLIPAWNALCQDALLAIATKGRRTIRNLLARLRSSVIEINDAIDDSPVAVGHWLLQWTMNRTEHFGILGMSQRLPTDQAWLPLMARVQDMTTRLESSVEEALAGYRALGEESVIGGKVIDARTIATFRKLCVVVGGPGSGKSLLLKILAREFAEDHYVSLRVRLRDLANRMQQSGCGVEEGLLQLGLDGTGVSPDQLRKANVRELVLLCDGLDECGGRQVDVASGLRDISASHPSYRIVVTTRPIGYITNELLDWRHYQIAPLVREDTVKHLETLCGCTAEQGQELLPRIRQYLQEGGGAQMLARSPLLLAFGAAVFLKWGHPSKSKHDLYQRIFRLLDSDSGEREPPLEAPARAIRNQVLNHLGWLLATSPLSPAEEIERRCAQRMQDALGSTYLQARAVVEASVIFWEQKGLIERLRHPDSDLIAFIHKTCGEFAAALHISEMESDEARKTINAVLANPDWDEILDFATATTLAPLLSEMIVAEFATTEPRESILNRLFRVVVRPECRLSPLERRSLLEYVFDLARSDDHRRACLVGRCLTDNDLSHMPEAEGLARNLASGTSERSRLIGWAVLACHFPDSFDRLALEDVLGRFLRRSGEENNPGIRLQKPLFEPRLDRGVFEKFLVGALKVLLADRNAAYQDRLVGELKQWQPNPTVGFVIRFEKMLNQIGREDLSYGLSPVWSIGAPIGFPKEFEEGAAALMTDVVPSAFLVETTRPRSEMKYLEALFEMAGILNTTFSDVYVWLSGRTQLCAVHALLRAAAFVFDLPAERLAAESAEAITAVEILRRSKDGRKSYLNVLPSVDMDKIDSVDWGRSRYADIGSDLLEDLVHHPSEWVRRLAARMLENRLDVA